MSDYTTDSGLFGVNTDRGLSCRSFVAGSDIMSPLCFAAESSIAGGRETISRLFAASVPARNN